MHTSVSNSYIMCDAHVHIHHCFPLDKFFDAAFNNFCFWKNQLGLQSNVYKVLILAERETENYFLTIKKNILNNKADYQISQSWTVHPTEEDYSVIIQKNEDCIVLISGFQIISDESIEVISLFTNKRIEDGQTLKVIVSKIDESGGIPVLPWGVGKWLGKRGKIINDLLTDPSIPRFFLGDNGGRPKFFSYPVLFRLAEEKNIPILPGSDPLPIPSEIDRPGSYGFIIEGNLSMKHPGQSLKAILTGFHRKMQVYGELSGLGRFISTQIKFRLNKK